MQLNACRTLCAMDPYLSSVSLRWCIVRSTYGRGRIIIIIMDRERQGCLSVCQLPYYSYYSYLLTGEGRDRRRPSPRIASHRLSGQTSRRREEGLHNSTKYFAYGGPESQEGKKQGSFFCVMDPPTRPDPTQGGALGRGVYEDLHM